MEKITMCVLAIIMGIILGISLSYHHIETVDCPECTFENKIMPADKCPDCNCPEINLTCPDQINIIDELIKYKTTLEDVEVLIK